MRSEAAAGGQRIGRCRLPVCAPHTVRAAVSLAPDRQFLPTLAQQISIAHTTESNRTSAFVYGYNPDRFGNPDKTKPVGIPTNFAITVNDNGAFFNARDPLDNRILFKDGGYNGGTLKAQARIMIHELAHLLDVPGFQPDFGSPEAGRANDKLVETNCKALVASIQQ